MLRFKKIFLTPLTVLLFFASSALPAQNLDRQQMEEIDASLGSSNFEGFPEFLEIVAATSVIDDSIQDIAQAYLSDNELSPEQRNALFRLLGIYTRLKYGEQAMATLKQLVAIPTFQTEGVPQHENPAFHEFAEVLGTIAADFDLSFRNVDDRVYEITLPGSSDELLGFHAHADVVPVNPELWVLEDGTRLDPFVVTRVGDRMYGRGTEDDKNGIVVSLYAMKVIKEEGLPLLRNLRLLVDTTEETSSTAIPYYFQRNPTPNYNIALDGSYPVIIAEKGYGTIMANFPVRQGSGEGAEVLSITGGLATNQIPAASVARIRPTDRRNLSHD